MSADPKEHRLALDDQPEFAQQVGLILSAFAILELSPPHLLAKLIGISHDNADMILGYHRNFKDRVDLLNSLATLNQTETQESEKIKYLCRKIDKCRAIRNKYAHGLWQMEGDGDRHWWRLINWLSDAGRNTTTNFVTIDSIKKDCAILRETLNECISYAPVSVPQLQPSKPPK